VPVDHVRRRTGNHPQGLSSAAAAARPSEIGRPERAARPRLLFLAHHLPFPTDSGAALRTYHVLRMLSQNYDITALCLLRGGERAHSDLQADVRALETFATIEVFATENVGMLRRIGQHLRSVVRRRAYTAFTHESRTFRRRVDELLTGDSVSLVHLDSLDLCGYLPLNTSAPVVCAHHNIESDLLRIRATIGQRRLVGRYLRFQAALVRREERKWCDTFAINVVVSEADGARLKQIASAAQVCVVPNGVDTTCFTPAEPAQEGVVFVGGLDWFPNLDALRYFCDAIMPALRRRLPDVRVCWVGRASDDLRRQYQSSCGLELTGLVDDIRPHVRAAACYVVPLRIGGGTRLKILDAWAMGKAVVSTSIGCAGLAARDGDNILIRDEPGSFAEAVTKVLTDPALRRSLEKRARDTAVQLYDWETIGRTMREAYLNLSR
jgi:polysaccharide biosynthesis protein PslH